MLTHIANISASAPPGGDSDVLTGGVIMWPLAVAPTGYLLCDGQAVSRATFLNLFTAIGTTFGVGDGSTTFNVPNYKGRVPVGVDASQTEFDAPAKASGAKTSTSSGSVAAPAFTGTANMATNAVSGGTPAGTIAAHATTADSTTTGGVAKVTGSTHTFVGAALGTHQHTLTPAGTNSAPAFTGAAQSILQPSLAINFIIKT